MWPGLLDAFRKTWLYRIFFWGKRPKRRLTPCPLLACPLCFSHKNLLRIYNHSWSFSSLWLWIEYSKPWYILWVFFFLQSDWMNVKVKVTQSHPTLCDPMDYTVHGILQASILPFPSRTRGSSRPRDWTQVPYIARGFFTSWATRGSPEWMYT